MKPELGITSEPRTRDTLDLAPRFTEHDALRLNRMFRGSTTAEMLEAVIRDGLAGDLAVVSSFGAESAVLLHLIASVDPAVPVLFLDTGKHFAETLAYRDTLVERLGLNLVVLTPDPEELAKRDETGLRWSYDPDGCCELRKVRPLEKALAHYAGLRIDAHSKRLTFSDSLDMPKAIALHRHFGDRVQTGFGIGTNLTNDVGPTPLHIVMKLVRCNDQPVAKLADSPGKTLCEDDTFLAYLRQVFGKHD